MADLSWAKKCPQCEKTKSADDFYRNDKMTSGFLSKCKSCVCSNVRKHRLQNIEKARQYDSERAKTDKRIASSIEQTKKWRGQDSRRAKCHSAVARAVKSGRLSRLPCSVCGNAKSIAHHEDYDRPLDVVWYCQEHHKARHAKIDAELSEQRIAA